MKTMKRTLLVIMAIVLAACSGNLSTGEPEPAPALVEQALGSIEFPPTWTPTAIPTQPASTATPPEAGAEDASLNTKPRVSLTQATSVPASMQMSGWQLVEGSTATFMLPGTFEVLDIGTEFGTLMAALAMGMEEGMMEIVGDLGESLGATPHTPTPLDLSEVEAAFTLDFVLAMQEDQKTSAFLFSEPLEQPSTLEDQVQATLDEQESMEVMSLERVINAAHETARLHLLATDTETGERGHVLIYLILLQDRVYQLGYTTSIAKFDEMLPVFETSASTFRPAAP